MPDPIACAAGKLDDPLMLEWALRYYDSLPENARDTRARIETTWFHDLFVAQLIEREDNETLSRLFRLLPARHFSNLTDLIVQRWPGWPSAVVSAAATMLAVNAPSELLTLFEADLQRIERDGSVDLKRFLDVACMVTIGTEGPRRSLFDRLSQQVLALPDRNFDKALLLPRLLNAAGALSLERLETVFDAALQIDQGEHRREGVFKALFRGLFGGAEYLDLVFARGKKESEQRLAPLAPLFSPHTPLAQLDQWLDAPPALSSVTAVLAEISDRSSACATMLKILRDSTKVRTLLPATLQLQLAMAACVHGFARETFDFATLDLVTTVGLLSADLEAPRWHHPLVEQLCTVDRPDVTTALISQMTSVRHTYGGVQLAESMGILGWQEFVPCLIDSLGEEQVDFLCEAAKTALVAIGAPAQAALIERWDDLDRSQHIFGLSVIRDVGGTAAADFALARFDELMNDSVEFCCELVLATPDQRLLERLRPELRRQQALIDRAFYIIARLLDQEDEDSALAKGSALEDLKKSQNIRKALDAGDFSRDSLSLELRCPSCNAVNRYDVKGVIMAGEPHQDVAYLVNDEFPCASCGQHVEFEFTTMAQMTLTAELLLINAAHESGQRREPLISLVDCRVDGQVLPLAAGLKRLRDRVAKTPTDARAWFQMGNLLSHINRPQATLAAFRRAVKLAPHAIDAELTLAQLLSLSHANEEAFELLSDALRRSSEWQFLVVPYPNFSQEFADLYNDLRRTLGRNDLPALHPSSLAPSKKVGRNDPCPCGSGKKFKKCCGQ